MELKAIKYGQVELLTGVFWDVYILSDGTSVMSERGASDLLGIHHKSLKNVAAKWPLKMLQPFCNMNLNVAAKEVIVEAKSPHKGRKILVYSSEMIENLIFGYSMAFVHDKLKPNQIHIGKRAVILLRILAKTALDVAIKEACEEVPEIQKTFQHNYSAINLIKEKGFISSLPKDIAIKKDIVEFLHVPDATLNTFLRKHRDEIKPVILDIATIRSLGSNSNRMHGYCMEDVAKIVFGMDTEVSLELKRRMFGDVATLSKPSSKEEISWREFLVEVFTGFNLQFNAPLGKYRIDFLIEDLKIALDYTQSNYPN